MAGASVPASPADVDLRNAEVGDADDVARMLTELGYPCDRVDAGNRIMAVAATPQQTLLVMRCDGRVCGLLALDYMYYLPLDQLTCRITALVVAREAQGRGLGRMLVREAERRARHAHAARLELTAAAHRTDALAFYRKCGFNERSAHFTRILGDT